MKIKTKKYPQIDTYFGTEIADPYRWLEDDSSDETSAWIDEQNQMTFDYLNQIPYRQEIKDRLTEIWDYETIGIPFVEGEYEYCFKNSGLQNQSVLYRINEEGEDEVFLDPNELSEDNSLLLTNISFSKDNTMMAYSLSEKGSDWRTIVVMDTQTKELLSDEIVDVRFSFHIAWKESEGFFYTSYNREEKSELEAKLYYHKIGERQESDTLIFGQDKRHRYLWVKISEDGKYLFIHAMRDTQTNELYLQNLETQNSPIVAMVKGFDIEATVIGSRGDKIFVLTDFDAPFQRLITVDASAPQRENWQDFISEKEHLLQGVTMGSGYFFARYMVDVISKVEQYDNEGCLVREVETPLLGTLSGFSGKEHQNVLYYSFSNYKTVNSIYKFDPKNGTSELYQEPKIDFDGSEYESKQIFYPSKDGTKIPMIITHKKGIKLDGNNPTLLYAYGGHGIGLYPSFSIINAVWLERGGIYAVPNIRGGGEYGKAWQNQGRRLNKQNTFDDVIAGIEYLIEQGYTSSKKLAIQGASSGGLTIGAVMTQRPDLMAVALPDIGLLDMLRYHTFPAGKGWDYDYGTAEESQESFEYLKSYSPLHNIKADTQYPATLITTADHDDRVVPSHSFKFTAELQSKQVGDNPILLRVAKGAGHGMGSTDKRIALYTDIFSFVFWSMELS